MGGFSLFVLIGLLILHIYTKRNDKKKEQITSKEESNNFKIRCIKVSNRKFLKEVGKDNFIMCCGEDQYNDIINDRDTKLVELKEEYRN